MIIESIFDMLFNVILWVISHMPSLAMITDNIGSIAGLVELLYASGFIIPWGTVLTTLSLWCLLQSFEFVVGLINWLIAKIPTVE